MQAEERNSASSHFSLAVFRERRLSYVGEVYDCAHVLSVEQVVLCFVFVVFWNVASDSTS